ncbi:hypothetical protein [Paenibacillus sp. NEAU-GSW1]|uniref:hypothetical protein n=1 Tax=Paenibacillus sp. NEAU-GSW1 TaxID=2682486 RepID=UPI0012E14CC1|nr:hypothetical protein [Paenibacillus sp. NEAU-GSW1]MUT67831.1 hypothetical protein [Paenibacillus sp. NEAU-GSW1]
MGNNEQTATPTAAIHSKQQLLASKKYSATEKDILAAILNDGQGTTHEQAQTMLAAYLKKEVM